MAFTSKNLWRYIWFLTVLAFYIQKCDTSHSPYHSSHKLQSRRSLNRHPLLSLLDNEADSAQLKTLESTELHQRRENRARSRYDLSYERHQDRDRNNRHSNSRLENDRHNSPRHHNQGSLYDKLAPFIGPKNLLVLKNLLGDQRDEKTRQNENRHRDNRYRENRHNENRYNDRKSAEYRPYNSERDHHLQTSKKQSRNQLQLVDRREHQALRYRNDDRDSWQDEREGRLGDRDRRQGGRERSYRNERDYDRQLDNRYQNQNYRYQDRKDLDDKKYSYHQRYSNEYNKKYHDSNNYPGHYQGRYEYRGSVKDQYRKPRRIDGEKSYNNLRAGLDGPDHKYHSQPHDQDHKDDQKYQARLKSLKARLSKNLQNLEKSPIKSLLRAADDLDCAAQLQCIVRCGEKKESPSEKTECKNTCEDEIGCNNDDEEFCNESGHGSCEGFGTGSTKGELLQLENNDGC